VKRVLVTGATGFIGRHCLLPLAARGFKIHALTHRVSGPEDVVWHICDMLDSENVARIVAQVRPTHLLHFAWVTEHGQYWHSLENIRWVAATLALLEAFVNSGGQRAVCAGTCAEYDWSHGGYFVENATPVIPASLYGSAKSALGQLQQAFAREASFSAAWGRVFFLYGPGESPARLVSSVCRALALSQPAACTIGKQLRDFLHVKDVADAFVALLDSDVEGAINIASGQGVSVHEICRLLGDIAGRPDLIRPGTISERVGEPACIVADIARLTNEVGWRPSMNLSDGLTAMLTAWRGRVVSGQ
jgi:nucleoside-diphosphate-sugar epimerase